MGRFFYGGQAILAICLWLLISPPLASPDYLTAGHWHHGFNQLPYPIRSILTSLFYGYAGGFINGEVSSRHHKCLICDILSLQIIHQVGG